jgi:small subunit ribosomal protein S1
MTDDEIGANLEPNFAELLNSYSSTGTTDLRIGSKVRGKIISISHDTIFVDIGSKIDGIVERAELLDENKQMNYNEGDIVELYVVELEEDEIRLSKALSGTGNFMLLKEAYENAVPVEGKILETCKGGLRVEVMGRKAFCPASQIDISFVENLEDYVGQTYQFLISKVDARDKNVVISRRALLNQELEKSKSQFYAELQIDSIMDGRVTKIMPYGVFVEIYPGVDGLVHVSELSWARVEDPQTAVSIGDSVRVKVIEIKKRDASDEVKISLSIKQITDDPWLSINDRFKAGQIIEGVIERKEKFGFFVTLAPGITGLLPKSKIRQSPQSGILDKLKEGSAIPVVITEILPHDRKMTLAPGESGDEQDWQQFTKKDPPSLGALGEKLQQALTTKKQK